MVAMLVLFATVAEIVLRVGAMRESNLIELHCIGTGALLNGQKGLFELDAVSGYKMQPNICVRLQADEYDQVLKTNSQGFVGPEVPALKAPGEFRIVVLGDRYTAGGQVPYEQNYTALLEGNLRQMGYSDVRVINAGVGGCGTFCQLGQLQNNITWMQPDLVVDSVFVGNNVSENVLWTVGGYQAAPWHPKGTTWGPKAAELVDQSGHWFPRNGLPPTDVPPGWDPSQPLPTPVGNTATPSTGPLTPQPVFSKRALWDGLRAHSLLLSKLFGAPIDSSVTTAPGELPLTQQQEQQNLTSFEWTILRNPPRTYWLDVAWPLFGHYIGEIKQTAATVGAPTVVIVIPHIGQFDAEARYRSMYDYRFEESEVDWNKPQERVKEQVDLLGLPEVDLLPIFRARPDKDKLYLPHGHPFCGAGSPGGCSRSGPVSAGERMAAAVLNKWGICARERLAGQAPISARRALGAVDGFAIGRPYSKSVPYRYAYNWARHDGSGGNRNSRPRLCTTVGRGRSAATRKDRALKPNPTSINGVTPSTKPVVLTIHPRSVSPIGERSRPGTR